MRNRTQNLSQLRKNHKLYVFLGLMFLILSCSKNEETQPVILSEVLATYSQSQLEEVIACAASKQNDNSIAFIYYYPIPEAINIRYYETSDVNLNQYDLSN